MVSFVCFFIYHLLLFTDGKGEMQEEEEDENAHWQVCLLPQYQQPHAFHENHSFSTAAPPVFQAMNMTMGKDGQTMGGVSFFNNIICYIFLLTNLEYYCHSTNNVTTTTTDTLPLQPQPLRRLTTSK